MTDIVFFGEMLLRLSSRKPLLLLQEPGLLTDFCGAEVNAAVALAGFGHACSVVTALPANGIGEAALADLRKFNLNTAFVARSDHRMGLYFLNQGAMSRPAGIIYDRAGSAFSAIDARSFRWDEILDGAEWLYVSGITAALGEGPLAALRLAIDTARDRKVKVAFDSNYRPALWRGREPLAKQILTELALKADLLFAGRRAVGMMVGETFDDADANMGFAAAAKAFFEISPLTGHVAATRREVVTSSHQRLTALLASREAFAASPTVELEGIEDRIGTGDAFGAAILHGLDQGMNLLDCARFARAASQWAHSVNGDYLRASLSDVMHLMEEGGGDVRR